MYECRTHVNLHLLVQAIIHDQAVGHSYAMRLHGMSSIVGIVSDIRVVEVCDLLRLTSVDTWRIERRIALGARGHVERRQAVWYARRSFGVSEAV